MDLRLEQEEGAMLAKKAVGILGDGHDGQIVLRSVKNDIGKFRRITGIGKDGCTKKQPRSCSK